MDLQTIQEKIANNQDFRKALAKSDLYWFFHIYFPHYIKYDSADFQREICKDFTDESNRFIELIAFRGGAKSTLASLGLPAWSIISGNYKFLLLISDTFTQAKDHIFNLKSELETNQLLIEDFGPFTEQDQWTATNIIIPKYNMRVSARSTGQKIRGIRYKQYRPDLMVLDDLENLDSVRTKEGRDKTYRWFTGELIPAGDKNTRMILLGNLLHQDCLMNKVKQSITSGKRFGIVKEFPFLLDDGKARWIGKFPTQKDIDIERAKVDDRTWQREYLLKIVPEEGQEIHDDWINNYSKLPDMEAFYQGTGVDLAISKKETADYTTMVSGKLFMEDGVPKIYIMPNPINERLSQYETIEKATVQSKFLGSGEITSIWVEQVAYQKATVEEMVRRGLPAEGVNVSTDKRARLRSVSVFVQNGMVVFPETGCEDLITQLTGFGIEKHDDLCDAFVYLVQKLMNLVSDQPMLT